MDQHGSHFSYPDYQPPRRRNFLFVAYLIMFGVMLGMVLMNVFSPRYREPLDEPAGTEPVTEVSTPEITPARQQSAVPVVTDGMLTDYEHAIIAAVRQATPAVVTITTSGTVYYRYRDPLFNMFSSQVVGQNVSELGSGVIIDPDGTIITNEHVISMVQNVQRAQIKVELTDGRTFDARVERSLYNQDIAILKIDAHDLPYLEVNPSTDLVQGQTVLAIGNPFGLNRGGEPTVTRGIVSATHRNLAQPDDNGVKYLRNMIQTDAAINAGNSGGALIDLNGRLVGINTSIYTNNGEGSIGIGFAIPVDQVRFILDSVAKYTSDATPWSGIGIQALTPAIAQALGFSNRNGVVISDVERDSPGDKYGFEQGDIIISINGYSVSTIDEARAIFRGAFPGEKFELQIFRQGGTMSLELVLGEKE